MSVLRRTWNDRFWGQKHVLPQRTSRSRFTPISRHIAMSVPRPARLHYRKPALCACQRQPSGVPIQRASKGRLFDQQYQDRMTRITARRLLLYWAHDLMS
jgi:hypothetical protein